MKTSITPQRITHALFISILPALIILANPIQSQTPAFSGKEYEDPAVFEINQNEPHAYHTPYDPDIITGDADNKYIISLNGAWKFRLFEKPEQAPSDFQSKSYNTRKWDEICVPSNWQMEGYGHPKFRNIALTFESDPPYIPDYYNPTGCYKKKFKIPNEWNEREVFIRFEGIKSAAYVWINGKAVGYNQGGFEPAEFNITSYIVKGNNEIAVKVLRFCDGSYLENQDMWRLSGIYRDVKIYSLPKVHIHDYFHYTDLDKNYKNASLIAEVDLRNLDKGNREEFSLGFEIIDMTGKTVVSAKSNDISIHPDTNRKIRLQAEVAAPGLWSAESPNLYNILYKLQDNNGRVIEQFTEKIGFREVEIKNEIFYINGVAVKLNGVNSHMHDPTYGQAVPLPVLWKDLQIMKRNNINAVRTCHYPPTPEYLDMADKIGIYIIDEVSDEAHANTQLSYDSSYSGMYRDRSRKLVHRDRNHTSVIMWSAGNESGSGPNIHEVIKTGKAIDPSRPGWMYGGNTFYIPFEDITGPRYWIPLQLENLGKGKILPPEDLRPAFMDEYLAATGNGLGGLDEYWEVIRRQPRILGGAIWDWVSPGIYTPLWITEDLSNYNNDGAIMGRPRFTDGATGRGLTLSGHDEWVEFYRDTSLDICGKFLTISADVNLCEIPQDNYIIMKGNHQYGLFVNRNNQLEFYVQENNNKEIMQSPYFSNQSERYAVKYDLPPGFYRNWQHIAGIYNGAALELFVNGEKVASESFSGEIAHSPFPLCIGRNAETQDQGEHSGRLSCMTIDNVIISSEAMDIAALISGIPAKEAVLLMDFENDLKQDDFLAVGLGGRTYGIIWPDRTVQPEIHQIKKSGQPLSIESIQPTKRLYRFINHYHFTDLNTKDFLWILSEDGVKIDSGAFKVNLPPGDTGLVTIPHPSIKSSGEIMLTLSMRNSNKTSYAPSGYEIAWEQFILQESLLKNAEPHLSSMGALQLTVKESSIEVTGYNFEYTFDKEKGSWETCRVNNKEMFSSPPLFKIWRAPLANDIDPWGSYLYNDKKMTAGLGRSIDNQFRSLGLQEMSIDPLIAEVLDQSRESITLKLVNSYQSSNLRASIQTTEIYTIYPSGSMKVSYAIVPKGVLPDIFPKTGWSYSLPDNMHNIEYFGRGPFENYPDRKTGAKIGIYNSDAEKEYVPYLIPQDYGNHSDTRWVKVFDESGHGLKFSGDIPFNFSMHKYTTENLSRAAYTYQLRKSHYNTLHISPKISGVGGTAVRLLNTYKVKPSEINYTLWIDPF